MRSFLTLLVLFAAFDTVEAQEKYDLQYPLGLKKMRIPRDNPLTVAKVSLGKQLFFDPRLSSDDTISCASCHDPEKGWADGGAFSTGVGGAKTGRSAPTVINSGYQYFQFWDGRAKQLEGQALGPIQSPAEMNMPLDQLIEKLSKIEGYRKQFEDVFGSGEIKSEYIAQAIASFERTVLSGDAPYDRFKNGDESALSEGAQRGMQVFFNKANCSACHSGPNFTDGGFHNIGSAVDSEDVGRFSETNIDGDRGSFKTPTLREIARTAPYLHDGGVATLEEVVEFYAKGGVDNPYLDEEIFKLDLTDQQKADLVTFLKEGLSSSNYPNVEPPDLPK